MTLHLKVTTGQEEQKNSENNFDQVIENKGHDRNKKEGVGEKYSEDNFLETKI